MGPDFKNLWGKGIEMTQKNLYFFKLVKMTYWSVWVAYKKYSLQSNFKWLPLSFKNLGKELKVYV